MGAESEKGAQQEDRGPVSHDSLLGRITITTPDDNHVVITMPAAEGTKPASHISPNSSNADNHADPSDSAYGSGAVPPSHAGQSPSGRLQDSSPEQWQQQQQQLGSHQIKGQSNPERLQQTQSDFGHQHAGSGHQAATPGDASNGPNSVQHQQARHRHAAGATSASLVSEPLSRHPPEVRHDKHMTHHQQQQLAPLPGADMRRLNQQQPKGDSAPGALSADILAESVHDLGAQSAPVTCSEAQSSRQHPVESVNSLPAPPDQSESGRGPGFDSGVRCRDQQLDALSEQLQSLVQSFQSINDSVLRVHEQIESLKSQ